MPMYEATLQGQMIEYFSEWFDVRQEVTSLCRKGRIDLIMYHRTDINKKYPFGLELKKKGVKRGGELGQWLNQAKQYTGMVFNEQKIFVFVFPQISHNYLREGVDISGHDVHADGIKGWHYNVNSFLYRCFGIGELQKYKNWKNKEHCRLVLNTNLIWDSSKPAYFNIDKLNVL